MRKLCGLMIAMALLIGVTWGASNGLRVGISDEWIDDLVIRVLHSAVAPRAFLDLTMWMQG